MFNIFQYGWRLPGGGLALATEGLTKARQVKTASSLIREGDDKISLWLLKKSSFSRVAYGDQGVTTGHHHQKPISATTSLLMINGIIKDRCLQYNRLCKPHNCHRIKVPIAAVPDASPKFCLSTGVRL